MRLLIERVASQDFFIKVRIERPVGDIGPGIEEFFKRYISDAVLTDSKPWRVGVQKGVRIYRHRGCGIFDVRYGIGREKGDTGEITIEADCESYDLHKIAQQIIAEAYKNAASRKSG